MNIDFEIDKNILVVLPTVAVDIEDFSIGFAWLIFSFVLEW